MKLVKVAKHKIKKIKRKMENKNRIVNIPTDKNKVWAFCAGNNSQDFRGNPKYLFIYISKYRPDIFAYWYCSNDRVLQQVKSLGFNAYKPGTVKAEELLDRTGVLVSEQVKLTIPKGLENAKYLNLWHGVGGVKNVERSILDGMLFAGMGKKYILHNKFYRSNQLYLAPSEKIVNIACDELGLDNSQIIRAGYPRCLYSKLGYEAVPTFNANLTEGLPSDTKIICYAPTYRPNSTNELFTAAIPNMESLIKVLEKNCLVMVFKMHPLIENESGWLRLKKKYSSCKWLKFWDNSEDFYEVLDQIDLCIYDFSSIFTDFVAAGTKHFLRYAFDFNDQDLNFADNYDSVTCGKKCKTFKQLLEAIDTYKTEPDDPDTQKIVNMYWEYADNDSFEKIINQTLNYNVKNLKLPTLYSFDIFDTVIGRKCLEPVGIFYYVKYKMQTCENQERYPDQLVNEFPTVRTNAEKNVREYYNRTVNERNDIRCEIQLDEIYQKIQTVYNLTNDQTEQLKNWEIEAELENVIPLTEQIDKIKQLLANGEKVVLISDMYLPKTVIRQMLEKADPVLNTLDLYLSSEYGYQKSRTTLYLEVYKHYGKNYNFEKWIHTGDNIRSDRDMARKLNIETRTCIKPEFNSYEQDLVDRIGTYDAYLVAADIARYRVSHHNIKNIFTYSYISLLFVPYVRWAVADALKDGKTNLYFVSRDGHQLKRIADIVKQKDNLKINIEYIYASRKVWRIPSFIDHIDFDFFSMGHGNFVNVKSYGNLLKAMNLTETEFEKFFPDLVEDVNKNTKFSNKLLAELSKVFAASEEYKTYLLKKAAEQRKPVSAYLEQVIDKTKDFAIVEYWGRGYTQENFTRLWQNITKTEKPVTFYYSRSTLQSEGSNIRKNYTTNATAQQYIESIFNCINYKSVESYKQNGNKWEPVIKPNNCDLPLFNAMEKLLPRFTEHYCSFNFQNSESIGRSLINFAMDYYHTNPDWEGFVKVLAKLKDAEQLYMDESAVAPPISWENIKELKKGLIKIGDITKNIELSLLRTTDEKIKDEFLLMYQMRDESDKPAKKPLKNRRFRRAKRLEKRRKAVIDGSQKLNLIYKKVFAKTVCKKQILLLTKGSAEKDTELNSLISVLNQQTDFAFVKRNVNIIGKKALAKLLAESEYIIIKKPLDILSKMDFAEQNKVVILSDSVITFFKKGKSKMSTLKVDNRFEKTVYSVKPNILQIPNLKLMNMYRNIYNLKDDLQVLPYGSVVTDMYFNAELKQKLLKRLYRKFPAAKHKKIIAYIPFERIRTKKAYFYQILNMKQLQQSLGKEYVVIVGFDKNNYNNKIEISGFSKILSEVFTDRELMLMADIIVGDYKSATFESPLLGVPVFMSTWDSQVMDSRKDTLFAVNDKNFGVEISGTDDFIKKVKDINNYNYKPQQQFKQLALSSCNGDSAAALFEFLKTNSLENK